MNRILRTLIALVLGLVTVGMLAGCGGVAEADELETTVTAPATPEAEATPKPEPKPEVETRKPAPSAPATTPSRKYVDHPNAVPGRFCSSYNAGSYAKTAKYGTLKCAYVGERARWTR